MGELHLTDTRPAAPQQDMKPKPDCSLFRLFNAIFICSIPITRVRLDVAPHPVLAIFPLSKHIRLNASSSGGGRRGALGGTCRPGSRGCRLLSGPIVNYMYSAET